MKMTFSNRQFFSVLIILFYLIPLFCLAFYSYSFMPRQQSWQILTLGLVIVSCGALSLMLLISYREESVREEFALEKASSDDGDHPSFTYETKVTAINSATDISNSHEATLLRKTISEMEDKQARLLELADKRSEEKRKIEDEKSTLLLKADQAAQEFSNYREKTELQLTQYREQINQLQKTVDEQRSEIEKKLEQIQQLDTKVQDLSYEIKALLYLHDADTTPINIEPAVAVKTPSNSILESKETEEIFLPTNIIKTTAEASLLLQRCVNIAQKLTAQYPYYGNEVSRYREASSPDHYSLDQRRLFDGLRSENGGLIIVYSPREGKVVFANQQTTPILGWSPEKCMQDFFSLIHEEGSEWKKALTLLHAAPENHIRFLMKTRHGNEKLMNCCLGMVPTGLFRSYVIAILYP